MTQVSIPAPWDLEYIYGTKEKLKELGATWNHFNKTWELPLEVQLPSDLQQYVV